MISAKVLARSKSSITGDILTTWELEYPRFILAELNTHRMLSKNSMSSRAVPFAKMVAQCRDNPAMPIHFGINQPGMKANGELTGALRASAVWLWRKAAIVAAASAEALNKLGLHKQVVNRPLEPYQTMKTVLTATETGNLWWLRDHEDAQPEFCKLVQEMQQACVDFDLAYGGPITLRPGDWHTPYFGDGYWLQEDATPLAQALAISSSCSAQVSYRVLDNSLEKAEDIYQKLVGNAPVHASPFEHSGTPMLGHTVGSNWSCSVGTWEEGITHSDRNGALWSGNFKGFIQHRQLIPNNVFQGE
jgi:hypothetical protein